MKVVVVYKDETDYARTVTDFLRDFEKQTGHQLETLDPETPDGIQFCGTYDIMGWPSIIATSEDGAVQKIWRGLPLPTILELSYYVR